MTILLTGGSGKTASRLAQLVQDASYPVLVASRKGIAGGYPAVKFDWTDESTFANPFKHPEAQESPITAVYLVAVGGLNEAAEAVRKFIGFAREKGVQRFVYLSSSAVEAGGPVHGKVHEYLRDLGVEWTVLRPTWFQENFLDQQTIQPVAKDSAVYSATGNGKIPFVSADDLAGVAFHALTDQKPYNTDLLILGPELLTYDDVATVLSEALGRQITHKNMTEAELKDHIMSRGLPEGVANILSRLDTSISQGSEARLSDVVEKVTGRPPIRFEDFAQKTRTVRPGSQLISFDPLVL